MGPIESFKARYKISDEANIDAVRTAVECVCEANLIAYEYLGSIDNKTNKSGFVARTHMNILGRLFEQSQGMLVCIATGAYTSAEALARVLVEGSINLMYMAVKGDETTIVGFLESWLIEHNRKLKEWKKHMEGTIHEERVVPIIRERQGLVSGYELFLDQIIATCGIAKKKHREVWPKSLFKRFSELGRETDYYESYHRLSGASHINGEDTISWLLSLNMNEKQKHDLAKEAAAYSVMMSRIASIIFIDSALACCVSHGRKENDAFGGLRVRLEKSVHDIERSAGVPN